MKTCNLDTVKNTPSEARRNTLRVEYYYIKTLNITECDSSICYKSVQCIIDMIYDMLDCRGMSALDNSVIYGYYSYGSVEPLFLLKDDVLQHNFSIIKLPRKKLHMKHFNTTSKSQKSIIVEYYFINFRDSTAPDVAPTWRTLRGVIESIWDLLSIEDLYFLGNLYICAYMSDGSIRRVCHIDIDQEERHIRISRVK